MSAASAQLWTGHGRGQGMRQASELVSAAHKHDCHVSLRVAAGGCQTNTVLPVVVKVAEGLTVTQMHCTQFMKTSPKHMDSNVTF